MNIANHLWQSTLFAAAVALLNWTLRGNRARVRHGLWLAALAKFLVPFSILIAWGGHIPRTAAPARLAVAVVAFAEPFSAPFGEPFSAPTPVATSPAASRLPAILFTIWAAGFLGIACSWWVRWRRVRAAVRTGGPVDLGLPLRAVSCATLLEPGVFGILRPVLLLPAGILERLAPEQLQVVVMHELYHVRHRDNLFAAFQMSVETVFWFHPLVWWIGRRLVEERERACDEAVLRAGSEPRIYAEAILNVCKSYTESPLACVSGVTGANLKKRIEAIMNKNLASDLRPIQKLGLAFAAIAAISIPIVIGMLHAPSVQAQALAAPTAEERQRREAYARVAFGNLSMVRTYVEYGPPDGVENRNSDPRQESQIWRYNYLPDFQSSVEFEFAPSDRGSRMRVNWPPPLETFSVDARASIAVYTAKQAVVLTVPLKSFSGPVDIAGSVVANGQNVANVRDKVNAGPGAAQNQWQTAFTLAPGSYSCHFLVREASGKNYTESIPFEVK